MTQARVWKWARLVAVALFASAGLFAGGAMTGCETVKGAGEDIQNLGEAGEEAIEGDGGE